MTSPLPKQLRPDNAHNFHHLHYDISKQRFRKEIYYFLITRKNEKDYYDLYKFKEMQMLNDEMMTKLLSEIREELHSISWKTATSFGTTGLFVYEKDKPPNCFEDGF